MQATIGQFDTSTNPETIDERDDDTHRQQGIEVRWTYEFSNGNWR